MIDKNRKWLIKDWECFNEEAFSHMIFLMSETGYQLFFKRQNTADKLLLFYTIHLLGNRYCIIEVT